MSTQIKTVHPRILIKQNGAKCEVWEESESHKTLKFSGGRVAAKKCAIDGNRRFGFPVFNVKASGQEVSVECPDWGRWDRYNLPRKITQHAKTLAFLEPIGTGGGCDFVTRQWGENEGPNKQYVCAVLSSQEDCSSSPDTLGEPSLVTFYPSRDWQQSLTLRFPTAREAMRFMNTMEKPEWCNIPDPEGQP